MGTITREEADVSTRAGRRPVNYGSGLFASRRLDQRDQATLDLQKKTLHQPEFAAVAPNSNHTSSADADGRSRGCVLSEPAQADALKNSRAYDRHKSSAEAAEGDLIDRILAGHKELFMDLVHPHRRTLYAMAFSLLANKEDAEDVTQDTLLKALARLRQFRRESAFGTWVIQIAVRYLGDPDSDQRGANEESKTMARPDAVADPQRRR